MRKELHSGGGNDGIALIAVLSFLGIMLILGITLVASMRTERMAAEASRNDVNARIFAKGCMYSAIEDINSVMWGGTTNIRVSKSLAVLDSESGTDPLGANSGILDGEVTNWIHRRFFSSGDPAYDARNIAATKAKWTNVPDPVAGVAGKGLIGRFVYVAFEDSGAYDANLVATSSVRSNGTSIGEADLLPEISDVSKFKLNRTLYKRFATLAEINFLNDGIATYGPESSAVNASALDNLVPYSLCYDAGWWDWVNSKWNLPGATFTNAATVAVPGDVDTWNAIQASAAFHALLGMDSTQADAIAVNFMDYLDADNVPGNVDSFATEAVPMINELSVYSTMTNVAGTVTHNVALTLETWFPFKGNERADTFTFRSPIVSASGSGVGIAIPSSQPAALPPLGTAPGPSIPASIPATVGFKNTTFSYTTTFPDTTIVPGSNIQFAIFLQNLELQDNANTVVDRVRLNPTRALTPMSIKVPVAGSTSHAVTNIAISVDDPRMNFSLASWYYAGYTPAAQNVAISPAGPTMGPYGKEGPDMYVRNGPMETPAEIGYLSMGSNWYTFPLASEAGRSLLTRFRARTNITEKFYTNGFVNPNTLNTNVLIAAFEGAPIERYPGEALPTYGTVDPVSQAGPIAQSIVSISENDLLTRSNTFDSGAAWVVAPIFASTNGFVGVLDNNQKESIIRNTYRMFNANQNLFTIVLIAQTINDVNKNGSYDAAVDEITGEKRVVAVVWRDPFPNPAAPTRHESFVRLFRYIDD